MKKILLHSIMAGPKGTRHPGVHDVPDDEAQDLIEAGYAEPHDGSESAAVAPRESAMLPRPRAAGTAGGKPQGNRQSPAGGKPQGQQQPPKDPPEKATDDKTPPAEPEKK